MTKKLISWLSFIAVFFSLYSCVHDELISSSDPASKEYHSKSLWKEDEVYIVNVKKIYEENEEKIRKEHGTPLWEYAMTMDKFDESYLLVPVRKNGEIAEVLEVPRFGKKIYFKYTNEEERLSFFRKLFIDTPKKTLPTSFNNEASKLICVTRTVSIWYPDSESNPNGSGHWGSSSYTTCYNLDIESFENPDDGSDGGGYDYPPFGGGGPDNPLDSTVIPQTPCAKIKSVVNNAQLKPKIDSLKQYSLTAVENEKGYQQDKSGNVTPAPVNGSHHVDFIINQNSLGSIHNHTLNGTHMFSPRDILTLIRFAGVQNQTLPVGSTVDNTGNAFLGMIAQSGSYFITFNGGSGDLPPPMTQAEEEAFEAEMNEAYGKILKLQLKAEGKHKGDDLSQQGLQKLFFDIVKEMDLEGKINLIQQNGSNTSSIEQNSNGTIKDPRPC